MITPGHRDRQPSDSSTIPSSGSQQLPSRMVHASQSTQDPLIPHGHGPLAAMLSCATNQHRFGKINGGRSSRSTSSGFKHNYDPTPEILHKCDRTSTRSYPLDGETRNRRQMDSGPRAGRQRSCGCLPLNVGDWCGSRRRTAGFALMPEGEYDEERAPFARHSARSSATRLRGLWRRIMKEKTRIFNPASPAPMAYDPHTYAQNFDEGSAWAEPEDLSRSFSARFAVPSRVLQRIR